MNCLEYCSKTYSVVSVDRVAICPVNADLTVLFSQGGSLVPSCRGDQLVNAKLLEIITSGVISRDSQQDFLRK